MSLAKGLRRTAIAVVVLTLLSAVAVYGVPRQTLMGLAMLQRASAGVDYQEQLLPSQVSMAYLDSDPQAGQEKPVIVMVHGITSNKDIWLQLLSHYPDHRVIAVDLPGHGDTDEPQDFDYRVENMSRQLADFVDALRLQRFHLVGNSLGGLVSGLYSMTHPEKVRSLVLMNTAGIDAPVKSEFMERAMNDRSFNPLLVKKPEDFDLMLSAVVAHPPELPAPVKHMAVAQSISRLDANSRVFDAVVGDESNMGKLEPLLPQLQPPTLLLWGDSDNVFHASSVDRALELAPQLQATVIEDCGHLPMIEAPAKTADILRDFFERQGAMTVSSG